MAELIKATDNLNEGRLKLNNAITDSEKALNTANVAKATADLSKAESESTQTQLDTIVIEGDSSVEAAQARVNNSGTAFPTLKQRLDAEHQEVTAQLQQKINKGEVTVNDIDKNKGKLDQTYLSEELLQQMAGDTPINAVPAAESITNEKLTPKSVDYNNTTFLKIGKNLFDKERVTIDHLLGNDGQVVEAENYYYSDYIPVQPSLSYVRKFNKMIIYYDKNKQWIGFEPSTYSFTTPENCKFLRLNGAILELEFEQLEKGAQSSLYEPYGYKITKWSENSIPTNAIEKKIITPNETSFMSEGNIFVEWTANRVIDTATGEIKSGTGYKVSETRHKIEPDTNYYFSHTLGKSFYRDDGTFIQYVSGGSGIMKTPTDASFIVLVAATDLNTDELVFIKSDSPVSYNEAFSKVMIEHLPNFKKLLSENLPDFGDTSESKWYGKTANFLGDSITFGLGLPTPLKPYPEYVKEILGFAEVRNYGISASTIANKFQPMSERYVDMSDDVDLIVVFGGTNDYGMHATELGVFSDRTNTTFYGALHVLIEGLIKKYPTKDVVFITPIHRQFAMNQLTDDKTLNAHGYELKDYRDAIDEVTEYYGVPVIDLFHSAGMNPNIPEQKNAYFQDIAHPNEAGHERLGQKISTGLLRI